MKKLTWPEQAIFQNFHRGRNVDFCVSNRLEFRVIIDVSSSHGVESGFTRTVSLTMQWGFATIFRDNLKIFWVPAKLNCR